MIQDEYSSFDKTPKRYTSKTGISNKYHKYAQKRHQSKKEPLQSPYCTKNVKDLKKTKTKISRSQQPINKHDETIKIKMNSTSKRKASKMSKNQVISSSRNQISINSVTIRKTSAQKSLKRLINTFSQQLVPNQYYSQRKFVMEVVDLQQNSPHKGRQMIDRKLDSYSYQSIMGDFRPFQGKKLPKLIIDQKGQIMLQK